MTTGTTNSKTMELPPRGSWARLPTPIEKLERLSAELGIDLYLKRDDQTGFEVSGNKIRKLEFLAEDALRKGATCLITMGGVQSNHCRATAALAARLGLRCVLFLRGEAPERVMSNNLLDRLFGAEIFYLTNQQYYEGIEDLRLLVDGQVRAQGGKTYFIPEGGSNGLGSYGYVEAFREIERQVSPFDSIVIAHGSGGTQAGLVLGKLMSDSATRIVGVNVCYGKKESFDLVKKVLWAAIQERNLPLSFAASDIEILDGFVGRGYALSTKEELAFILKIAREEGVLVDPVYTGKALHGLYQTVKKDRNAFGKRVLFIHTGGGFGLFKMEEEWKEVLA
ncbi:MAG: 1-aminocyclopropane-1-carboxylate deaminase/D-cysteine desulfhydrase [Bdellovibrionota bacterium]